MLSLIHRARILALDIAALMLGALFIVFLIQIAARYVFNAPALWTLEACLTLWLWVVFWGGAFVLQEKDHVRFDVLYIAVGRNMRRAFAIISALAIGGGMLAALPATWSYITFYQIKRSAVIGIRLDIVFSIYAVFAVMLVIRYFWRAFLVARGADPDELDRREIQDGYHVQ
ncbi:TRAP transporter small permease subunit [Rhabdaerophilum sp. SD176]|uniref:TRAP transporter small permease n=1 Tax=Rhabdaerophilum sp. SD176 TaxID=2983548 RepID=UPI0024DF3A4A|nr:TRAP transporter small permease subunit [Rhabdaerophilum sp. SD176]